MHLQVTGGPDMAVVPVRHAEATQIKGCNDN